MGRLLTRNYFLSLVFLIVIKGKKKALTKAANEPYMLNICPPVFCSWQPWMCSTRKHPTRQFYKISVLGGMVSWKIVSVLTKFWESSPGKYSRRPYPKNNIFVKYCLVGCFLLMCDCSVGQKVWTLKTLERVSCKNM